MRTASAYHNRRKLFFTFTTMRHFEAHLQEATNKGPNGIPGAVAAVVGKDGTSFSMCSLASPTTELTQAHTSTSIAPDAKPLNFDATFYLGSLTKLFTSVASLQLVERGQFKLDDPIDAVLPELASQPIIKQNSDGTFDLRKANDSITLRHFLTHSAGTTYDMLDPTLLAWRDSRGEKPVGATPARGDVAKGFAYTRTYEAGES